MSNYTTTSIGNSHFSKWMPFLGVYIAVATFVCIIAISVDLVRGVLRKQYWIPSNCSSINAVSITIIAAAAKLSLDISTSMPRQIDQLTKLSTSAFVCIALASIAPSVGKLENREFLSNTAALSVFVITSVVGLCIQLRTGIIFTFQAAHITIIVMISIILVKCALSTASLSVFKSYLNVRYHTQHQNALSELLGDRYKSEEPKKYESEEQEKNESEKLKTYLERFSMMAHSGCPHFLMARLIASVIYALCGLVAAITFFTILTACGTHKDKFLGPTSLSGTSSYDWSVLCILVIQTIGVGVGTTVLCFRGFYTVMVHSGKLDPTPVKERIKSIGGKYWLLGAELSEWVPLFPYIEYREQKWLGYLIIYPYYATCLSSQMLLTAVDLFLFWLIPTVFWIFIKSVMKKPGPSRGDKIDPLRPYFLQLDAEATIKSEVVMDSISNVTMTCLRAEERETTHLRKLLRLCCSDNFQEVDKFKIPPVPRITSPEPAPDHSLEPAPSSWALSVLTLTWIAIALPDTNSNSMDELVKSVREGLVYVKLIEDKFNYKHELCQFRLAATILWGALTAMPWINFCLRYVRLDFRKLLLGDIPAREIETLKFIRKRAYELFTKLVSSEFIVMCPYVAAGAHYAYGACDMILKDSNDSLGGSSTTIFDMLRNTIADILGACLVNLNFYIRQECEQSSSIEKRPETACKILKLFGETEEIMKTLEAKIKKAQEGRTIPHIAREKMMHMDSWRKSDQPTPPAYRPAA